MPPAFNLSQDQTLQFNLCKTRSFGIEVNFTTSEFHFIIREHLIASQPPDTHAYRLSIFKELAWQRLAALRFALRCFHQRSPQV